MTLGMIQIYRVLVSTSGQGQEFQLMRDTFLPHAKGKCENAHLKTIS